jgi:hypothetical protein
MDSGYILFDIPEGVEPEDRAFLEGLGHAVKVCNGPPHGELCPILAGEGCPLAQGAHGIVFELDLDRPQHRAILKKYKAALRPDLPMRVIARSDQVSRHRELLSGLKVWDHTPAAGDLDAIAAEVESTYA